MIIIFRQNAIAQMGSIAYLLQNDINNPQEKFYVIIIQFYFLSAGLYKSCSRMRKSVLRIFIARSAARLYIRR